MSHGPADGTPSSRLYTAIKGNTIQCRRGGPCGRIVARASRALWCGHPAHCGVGILPAGPGGGETPPRQRARRPHHIYALSGDFHGFRVHVHRRACATGLKKKRSLAAFRRAQISAEERYYVVLKAISDGAGMGAVINLKAVGDAIGVEDLVQFDRVES